MSNTIKYYDAQQWLRETQPKRAKLPAVVVAVFVTLLTSAVAGLLVGLCFLGTFWYWAIGSACISLPYKAGKYLGAMWPHSENARQNTRERLNVRSCVYCVFGWLTPFITWQPLPLLKPKDV